MKFLFTFLMLLGLLLPGTAQADDRVDLIDDSSDDSESVTGLILDASGSMLGQYDQALGAASALNRALGLYFSGSASPDQLNIERGMVKNADPDSTEWAFFASDVLVRLNKVMNDFPSSIELRPFDLSPSEMPVVQTDNPHIVIVHYNHEEYLERLLQRLYFKLIQGPVLLTVPYQAEADSVPEEYRHWNNFRYGPEGSTMVWNEYRMVYVDWDLTQTVVLNYEDGKIACYDHGNKYYIDHTAAVAAAGAMLAHPAYQDIVRGKSANYVLTSADQK